MKFLVSRTFSEITPESAEHGDFSDTGFVYQDEVLTLSELKSEIRRAGFTRERNTGGPKSSPCSTWVETEYYTSCYGTGTSRSEALHVTLIK